MLYIATHNQERMMSTLFSIIAAHPGLQCQEKDLKVGPSRPRQRKG